MAVTKDGGNEVAKDGVTPRDREDDIND